MWQSGLPAGEDFRPESSGGDVVILHWEVYSHMGDSTESTVVALHYNVFLSNQYCCVVSCTVYTDVHCCTPGGIEDSVMQYSVYPNSIRTTVLQSVHRTILYTQGLLRTSPLRHFTSLVYDDLHHKSCLKPSPCRQIRLSQQEWSGVRCPAFICP